ncbi:low molecular weight protein-tyrosine-phosphatase [Cupriavidus metallidurans]|uniref:protein-tyrosine-phosphatase n=1 Tax=Cupriavidus metallidurans (strain ATCC 43123 / DSM 2839 / NBRC 102507 / CH34) TaxID=266264 RepID=Q1LAW7_CUPMC|nr:low molecular weight protein-tyrosine-phosphatase [Cupriavidus metallidurans]ABF12709.1 protein tyrosine phosphatase [Cupriavidus metallidurans CH34]
MEVMREGKEAAFIRSILVVCIGNRCRSPMAAALLGRALPQCRVLSAGLAPPVGAAADPRAVRLLAVEGSDLTDHRARAVSAALVAGADLVLVMDEEQRDALEDMYPQARGKTYRLCEQEQTDVPDPFSGSMSMFVIALGLIKMGVESWSARIHAAEPAHRHGGA